MHLYQCLFVLASCCYLELELIMMISMVRGIERRTEADEVLLYTGQHTILNCRTFNVVVLNYFTFPG